MNRVEGNIDNITTKEVKTKFGPKPVYMVEVNGTVVNCGFRKPSFHVGEYVEWDTEIKYGELQLVTKGQAPSQGQQQQPQSRGTTTPPRSQFPVGKDTKDISIIRQSALKAAVETFALSKDSWSADDMDDLAEQIIHLAYKYAEFGSGHREVKAAKKAMELKQVSELYEETEAA